MKRQMGFTLLELLISISLSGFIMLGMMQLYMGVVRYVEASRDITHTNRKICLLFNQLERDLSTAYIPFLQQEIKPHEEKLNELTQDPPAQPSQNQTKENQEDVKKAEQKAQEQRKKFFVAITDDRVDPIKIGKKRFEQCKYISFICSNPLQVYGEKREQLVRVVYEVMIDKQQSTKDVVSYKLLRKETQDLFNVQAKVGEFERIEPSKMVKSYLVADNVKNFAVEFVMPKKKKPEDRNKAPDEPTEIRSSKWGDTKDRSAIVPEKAFIWLDMWDQKKLKTTRFTAMFPILGYPTIDEKEKDNRNPAAMQTQAGPQPQHDVQAPANPTQSTLQPFMGLI